MIAGDIPADTMTLADAYAGLAPEVPDWFAVDPLPPPTKPELPSDLPADLLDNAWAWMPTRAWDLGDTWPRKWKSVAEEFARKWVAYLAACERYTVEEKGRRFFAWRWHYARRMLANRPTA